MKKTVVVFFVLATVIACKEKEAVIDPSQKKIVYDPDIKNIMFNYCLSCHSGSSAISGLDLSSYQKVKDAVENKQLVHFINNANNPMPPSGLMPASERQKIENWVQNGFLEN
jgi:uncharacterized membrane protein